MLILVYVVLYMNIFPNRKCLGNRSYNNIFSQEKHKNNIYKIEQFPSPQNYFEINDKLLKNYLKIDMQNKIETKIKNTIIKNNVINDLENNDIYNINLSFNHNNKNTDLLLLKINEKKSIKDYISHVNNKNLNLIFNQLKKKDMENIVETNKLIDIKLLDILKTIFINLIKTTLTTNFCNIWLFGSEVSLFIQGTYIPISEVGYSEGDYLDLILDLNEKSYKNITDDDIFGNIDLSKSNESLYFLLFK